VCASFFSPFLSLPPPFLSVCILSVCLADCLFVCFSVSGFVDLSQALLPPLPGRKREGEREVGRVLCVACCLVCLFVVFECMPFFSPVFHAEGLTCFTVLNSRERKKSLNALTARLPKGSLFLYLSLSLSLSLCVYGSVNEFVGEKKDV